jgi:hypothetical protein
MKPRANRCSFFQYLKKIDQLFLGIIVRFSTHSLYTRTSGMLFVFHCKYVGKYTYKKQYFLFLLLAIAHNCR